MNPTRHHRQKFLEQMFASRKLRALGHLLTRFPSLFILLLYFKYFYDFHVRDRNWGGSLANKRNLFADRARNGARGSSVIPSRNRHKARLKIKQI